MNYEELQLKLEKFRNIDLSTVSYDEIVNAINVNMALPVVLTELYAGNYIERIRINRDGELFTSKKELSYRSDIENINRFGRANCPGSSIFYGAVVSSPIQLPRIVALAESEELLRSKDKGKVDKDLIMTVSKWQITKTMVLAEMVFKKDRGVTTPEIEKSYQFHLKKFRENMPEKEVLKIISILEFYSEEFAKSNIVSDSDYKISAAYAESAFKIGNVQGIIYPSVRTDYEGSNVALLPETVDKHLQFEEAILIHVQIRGKKVFLDNLYRTGIVPASENDFSWYAMEPASQKAKDTFFKTGKI